MLAEALAATYDVNLAVTARAADLLEAQAVRWVAEFVGYPARGGRLHQRRDDLQPHRGCSSPASGRCPAVGTMASPAARAPSTARRRRTTRSSARSRRRASARTSRRLLGQDERRRMRVDELDAAIAADVEAGSCRSPWSPTAARRSPAPSTRSPRSPTSASEHGVWLHVDGAYGLPAAATETAGPLFAGLERADSVTLDAHKWLGLQKSCSLILLSARRGRSRRPSATRSAYMRRDSVIRNAVERTLEYSRPLRSLKLWLAFRTHGAAAFRGWIEANARTRAPARRRAVGDDAEFELLCEPHALDRVLPPRRRRDRRSRRAQHRVGHGDPGRRPRLPRPGAGRRQVCLRVCFVNFRTRPEDVDFVLETGASWGSERRGAPKAFPESRPSHVMRAFPKRHRVAEWVLCAAFSDVRSRTVRPHGG